MSKIICDVCGTSYPETATQCPICGCMRPAESQGLNDGGDTPKTYTHVKGGRFSKANVRKRNKAGLTSVPEEYEYQYDDEEQPDTMEVEQGKSGIGLVITAIVLLLAIVAVVVYIALRFFMPAQPDGTTPQDTSGNAVTTTVAVEQIPCEGIQLDVDKINLESLDSARMLYVSVEPANTTDTVAFSSSDESVVTVTDNGKVTAVGEGRAVITVTCGSVSIDCDVVCNFYGTIDDTTETTEESTEATTLPVVEDFHLNRTDITFSRKGSTWLVYDGELPLSAITWTSDDERIAKIENGTVTAVGSGVTNVHAEYNGEKISCIIRCVFKSDSDDQGVTGNGGVSEDGGGTAAATAKISHTDVTIKVTDSTSESFVLTLTAAGETLSVEWTVGNSAVCTVSGNTVTAVAVGTTTVSAVYNGVTYSCIVRVSNA